MEQWLSPLACIRDKNERHTFQITTSLPLVSLASSLTDGPAAFLHKPPVHNLLLSFPRESSLRQQSVFCLLTCFYIMIYIISHS